jgi:toluene monooxygenase system protein A
LPRPYGTMKPVMKRETWFDLARKLDWTLSYVDEREVFPEVASGRPWLPSSAWADWEEPYRTTYSEYVTTQSAKETAVHAVRRAVGGIEDFQRLDRRWLSALKLHVATLPLAEFAAVVGNLRAARFGRDSAWRTTATLGALDEMRHAQIPLLIMHELVRWDPQFEWTHFFYHSNQWVAIAGRHLMDELLLASDPIEFAIATNFVFETGFTNLQFVGLAAVAHGVGDRMFETMIKSIQTDEARHSQIGPAVLAIVVKHDRAYAQHLVDKWFWRQWHLFAIVTGFAMDYLTPLASRTTSFKEFMEEWVLDQFARSLADVGLDKPWYWDEFVASIESYHHMVYASAYSYRATVWFDLALPSPDEREWLRSKYPTSWPAFEPVWERLTERWQRGGPEVEWYAHGTTPVGFCNLCQLVLCAGTPSHNTARTREHGGRRYIFCSEPCERLFMQDHAQYAAHKDIVARILAGEAPGNLLELLRNYFGLAQDTWGKDVEHGNFSWLHR